MGSLIKTNAILKLTDEAGMPLELVVGERYEFRLPGRRLFQLSPVWVQLVHEIDGKWKYVGHAHIIRQTIDTEREETTGIFEVVRKYNEEYSILASKNEAPTGESYY